MSDKPPVTPSARTPDDPGVEIVEGGGEIVSKRKGPTPLVELEVEAFPQALRDAQNQKKIGNAIFSRNPENNEWFIKGADGSFEQVEAGKPYLVEISDPSGGSVTKEIVFRTSVSEFPDPKDVATQPPAQPQVSPSAPTVQLTPEEFHRLQDELVAKIEGASILPASQTDLRQAVLLATTKEALQEISGRLERLINASNVTVFSAPTAAPAAAATAASSAQATPSAPTPRIRPDAVEAARSNLRDRVWNSPLTSIIQMRLTERFQSADSLEELSAIDTEFERLMQANSAPGSAHTPASGTTAAGAAPRSWTMRAMPIQTAAPHAPTAPVPPAAPATPAAAPASPGNSMDAVERNIATLTQQVTALTQQIEALARRLAAAPPAATGTPLAVGAAPVPAALPDVSTPAGAAQMLDLVNSSVTTLQNRVAAAKRGLEANGTWTEEDERRLGTEADTAVKAQMEQRKRQIAEWKQIIEDSERRLAPFTTALVRQDQQLAATHPPAVVAQADRIRENIGNILHRRERGWKNFLPHWFKMAGASAAAGVSTGILLRFFLGAGSGGLAFAVGAGAGAVSAGARTLVEINAAKKIIQGEIEKARTEGNSALAAQKEEQLAALTFKHWKTWRRALGNIVVGAGIGAIGGVGAYEFSQTEMGQSAKAWLLGALPGFGAGKGVGALQAAQNAVPTRAPAVTDVPKLGGRIPADPSMVGPRGPRVVPPINGPRGTFMPVDPSTNPRVIAETRRMLAINGITLRPDQHIQIIERQGQRLTAIYQDICVRGNRKPVLIGVIEQRAGAQGAVFHRTPASAMLDGSGMGGRRGGTFAEQVQQRSGRGGGNASYFDRFGRQQRWTPSNTTFGRGVVGGKPVTDARILNPDFVNRVQGMFGGGRSNVADVTPGFRGRMPAGAPIADAAGPRVSAVPPGVVETIPVTPQGRVVPPDAYRFTPRGAAGDVMPQTNNSTFSGRAAEMAPLPSDAVRGPQQFAYVSPRAAGFEHVVEAKASVGNNAWAFMQKSVAQYLPAELQSNKAALDKMTQALWQELGKLDASRLSQLGFQNGTNIALIGDKGPGQVLNFTRFFADENLMTSVMRTLQKGDPALFAKMAPGLSEAHYEAVKSINPGATTRIIAAWEEAARQMGRAAAQQSLRT